MLLRPLFQSRPLLQNSHKQRPRYNENVRINYQADFWLLILSLSGSTIGTDLWCLRLPFSSRLSAVLDARRYPRLIVDRLSDYCSLPQDHDATTEKSKDTARRRKIGLRGRDRACQWFFLLFGTVGFSRKSYILKIENTCSPSTSQGSVLQYEGNWEREAWRCHRGNVIRYQGQTARSLSFVSGPCPSENCGISPPTMLPTISIQELFFDVSRGWIQKIYFSFSRGKMLWIMVQKGSKTQGSSRCARTAHWKQGVLLHFSNFLLQRIRLLWNLVLNMVEQDLVPQ